MRGLIPLGKVLDVQNCPFRIVLSRIVLEVQVFFEGTASFASATPDYTANPDPAAGNFGLRIFTIPTGETTLEVIITPIWDDLVEGNELATITLKADPGYALGTSSQASVTILDFIEEVFSDGFEGLELERRKE